jgi:truncated hemoglobin YjbI
MIKISRGRDCHQSIHFPPGLSSFEHSLQLRVRRQRPLARSSEGPGVLGWKGDSGGTGQPLVGRNSRFTGLVSVGHCCSARARPLSSLIVLPPWLPDSTSPVRLRRFVRQFANRVADDALLSTVFPGGHQPLAQRMYAWWEQALSGLCYTGRPPGHEPAKPLTAQHFVRWCGLLEASLNEEFSGPLAMVAKGHVLNVGTMVAHWQLTRQCTGQHHAKALAPA